MEIKINYQNIKIFAPAIFKVKIPEIIVERLNNHIDKIINDKEKSEKLNYGESLVGDVTQEFLLEKEIAEKSGWLDFLAKCTKIYIELNEEKKNIRI